MAASDILTIRCRPGGCAARRFVQIGLLTACLLVFLTGPPAHAQSLDRFRDDDPDAPWHIVADEVSYDQATGRYTAVGNAEIFKEGRRLGAERIVFDEKEMTAVAEGQVMLTFREDVLTARRVEIDLRSETGTLHEGTIFLQENHFIIRGDRISKIGKQAYEVERGSFSTCDGDPPDWKITARRLNVTLEGYGRARHAALWARDVPIAYTPYLVFPAKRRRQSGLLAPEIAFSDRKGTEFQQPLFWAIDDSRDATFYAHYMSKRGLKLGGEYRYVLDARSRGTLMFDYLDDRKVDDGTGSSSDDYGFDGDQALRTNRDRYWLRGKADQKLPYDLRATLDIDWVSDQDYLREFNHGPSGYYSAYNALLEDFGRELDQIDDPVRTNRLNLNRTADLYSFNSGVRWRQNAILMQEEADDPTVQRLPYLQLDATRQRVLDWPVYATFAGEYANLYREDGTRGNRAILAPRVIWPWQVKNYLYIEPSAGVTETVYYIGRFDPADEAAAGGDRTMTREAYDLRLDLFSEASRDYATRLFGWDRIQHRLRPQVVYAYVPDIDQEEYPRFDFADRIEPANRVTYSLVNAFISRRETHSGAAGEAETRETGAGTRYAYREFGRFKIEQSYDIREQRADDADEFADGMHRRPFSPITAELEVFPGRYVSLSADTEWSSYDNRFLTHNLGAGLVSDRGDRLSIDYHYQRGTRIMTADGVLVRDRIAQETVSASGLLKLDETVSIDAGYSRDIEGGETTWTFFGILYQRQCWSVKAGYEVEDDDRRVAFSVLLHGLGSLGSSL